MFANGRVALVFISLMRQNFPVFSRGNTEYEAETGSPMTVCSANFSRGRLHIPNSALGPGVGKKELLAVDRVAGDGRLPFGADQPIDEGLPLFRFHRRVLRRID